MRRRNRFEQGNVVTSSTLSATGMPTRAIPMHRLGYDIANFLVAIATFSVLMVGCATLGISRPKPVSVAQIVEMSKAGVPAQEIIREMRNSRTAYRLKASQLARLREQGVPDAVIDYMQQTYLDAVRRDQALEDWNLWTQEDDGFWYGGAPYGWRGY
jgi:hypothetical protein